MKKYKETDSGRVLNALRDFEFAEMKTLVRSAFNTRVDSRTHESVMAELREAKLVSVIGDVITVETSMPPAVSHDLYLNLVNTVYGTRENEIRFCLDNSPGTWLWLTQFNQAPGRTVLTTEPDGRVVPLGEGTFYRKTIGGAG